MKFDTDGHPVFSRISEQRDFIRKVLEESFFLGWGSGGALRDLARSQSSEDVFLAGVFMAFVRYQRIMGLSERDANAFRCFRDNAERERAAIKHASGLGRLMADVMNHGKCRNVA